MKRPGRSYSETYPRLLNSLLGRSRDTFVNCYIAGFTKTLRCCDPGKRKYKPDGRGNNQHCFCDHDGVLIRHSQCSQRLR